jgi:hypothetical protein
VSRWKLVVASLMALVAGAGVASADEMDQFSPMAQPAPAGVEVLDEHERARGSADARRNRAQSRRAFAGLGRDAALLLAQQRFAEHVYRQPKVLRAKRAGEAVSKYLDQYTAVVREREGESDVLVSMWPLLTDGADPQPIDLGLEARGGRFVSKRPLVKLGLPRSARGPVTLDDLGISFTPVGAASVEGSLERDHVYFHEAFQDTDMIVNPLAEGAEISWVLRSELSPSTFALDVDMPAGLRLRAQPAPSFGTPQPGGVEIVNGADEVVGVVQKPSAFDADSETIPMTMSIVGDNRLEFHVDTSVDAKFPILADPVVDVWGAQNLSWACMNQNTGGHTPGWYFAMFGSTLFDRYCPHPSFGDGAWISTRWAQTYSVGQVAQLSWPAPPKSYFTYAWFDGLYHYHWASKIFTGLWSSSLGYFNYWEQEPSISGWGSRVFDSVPYQANPAAENASAVFGIGFTAGTGPRYGAIVGLRGAQFRLDDRYPPFATASAWTNPSISSANAFSDPETGRSGSGSAWFNPANTSPTVKYVAHDDGLGLKATGVLDVKSDTYRAGPIVSNCQGHYASLCPNDVSYSNVPVNLKNAAGNWLQGVRELSIKSTDITDTNNFGWSSSWFLRVDAGAPDIGVGGTLADAEGATIGNATYTFDAWASDGSLSSKETMRSGVASLRVYINGTELRAPVTQTCPASSCALRLPQPISFNPTDYEPDANGRYDVHVVATDFAGNQSARHVHVYQPRILASSPLIGAATATTPGSYSIDVKAWANSGIAIERLELLVDAQVVQVHDEPCATSGCALGHRFWLNTGPFASGAHSVSIAAIDANGVRNEKTWAVNIDASRTYFEFNPPLSLTQMKSAASAAGNSWIEFTDILNGQGGYVLGAENPSTAIDDYLASMHEEFGASADPQIRSMTLGGDVPTAGLGGSASSVMTREVVTPNPDELIDAPPSGDDNSGFIYPADLVAEDAWVETQEADTRVESPTATTSGARTGAPRFAPKFGLVRTHHKAGAKRPRRIEQRLTFGDDALPADDDDSPFNRDFNLDHGYEQDFKLIDRNTSGGKHPNCGGRGKFWAERKGVIWRAEGVPEAAHPYFDWDAGDPCKYRDFTIGFEYPLELKAGKTYELKIWAYSGETVSSDYYVNAQKMFRYCTGNPDYCAESTGGGADGWVLVGESRGHAPDCRRWRKTYDSVPC